MLDKDSSKDSSGQRPTKGPRKGSRTKDTPKDIGADGLAKGPRSHKSWANVVNTKSPVGTAASLLPSLTRRAHTLL